MKQVLLKSGAWLNRRSVRFIMMLAVLIFIFAKIDRSALITQLSRFDPAMGVAIVGIFLLSIAVFALRWWYISRALGVCAPFKDFIRVLWISQSVSECGPPLVVGELARFQLMRGSAETWQLIIGQVIDRFSGKIVLLLMVLGLTPIYLGLYSEFPGFQIGLFALILIAAVSVAVLVFRKFWPMARLHAGVVLAICNPLRSPRHYGLSVLIQLLLAANFALAAVGLGISGDALTVLMLGPLLLLGVSSLPGLVSDWGKREAAAVFLLAPAGLTPEQSLAVSLIFGALHLLTALPGALLLLLVRRRATVSVTE
ncbi:lysylphosphatidylglycerol synthase transmembrane domain-containing protein [Methylocaldum gracile]|uniref:lysylphosphatidylglycerol synthase transmembrane domain-containing protein n=1 Tax=unclassified Methylocaldum TaxID=2622260 RepID=UPI0010609617